LVNRKFFSIYPNWPSKFGFAINDVNAIYGVVFGVCSLNEFFKRFFWSQNYRSACVTEK
jgi:hypothetical protein